MTARSVLSVLCGAALACSARIAHAQRDSARLAFPVATRDTVPCVFTPAAMPATWQRTTLTPVKLTVVLPVEWKPDTSIEHLPSASDASTSGEPAMVGRVSAIDSSGIVVMRMAIDTMVGGGFSAAFGFSANVLTPVDSSAACRVSPSVPSGIWTMQRYGGPGQFNRFFAVGQLWQGMHTMFMVAIIARTPEERDLLMAQLTAVIGAK